MDSTFFFKACPQQLDGDRQCFLHTRMRRITNQCCIALHPCCTVRYKHQAHFNRGCRLPLSQVGRSWSRSPPLFSSPPFFYTVRNATECNTVMIAVPRHQTLKFPPEMWKREASSIDRWHSHICTWSIINGASAMIVSQFLSPPPIHRPVLSSGRILVRMWSRYS